MWVSVNNVYINLEAVNHVLVLEDTITVYMRDGQGVKELVFNKDMAEVQDLLDVLSDLHRMAIEATLPA